MLKVVFLVSDINDKNFFTIWKIYSSIQAKTQFYIFVLSKPVDCADNSRSKQLKQTGIQWEIQIFPNPDYYLK